MALEDGKNGKDMVVEEVKTITGIVSDSSSKNAPESNSVVGSDYESYSKTRKNKGRHKLSPKDKIVPTPYFLLRASNASSSLDLPEAASVCFFAISFIFLLY